jgi:hemerythrin-like domain-containing protein
MEPRDTVIDTIRSEHRSMRAVMKALQTLLAAVAAGHAESDHGMLCAAVYYLDEFPEKTHHPKEDRLLFPAVRATGRCDTLLDELEADHARGQPLLLEMNRALVHYLAGARDGLDRMRKAVDAYAGPYGSHILREERLLDEIGPLIADTEWSRLAAAFAERNDPAFGTECRAEFRRLHQTVLRLLPRKMWSLASGEHDRV